MTLSARRKEWWYIATWFGAGNFPVMSGTFGSLAALPFAYFIQQLAGNIGLWIAAFIIFAIGCWASSEYMKHMGSDHDPKQIVVDEVAGMWLLLSAFPITWQGYLVAFIIFRAFDIVKPWPISWVDKNVHGGLGVMLDDMLAAALPVLIYLAAIIAFNNFGTPDFVHSSIDFIHGNF